MTAMFTVRGRTLGGNRIAIEPEVVLAPALCSFPHFASMRKNGMVERANSGKALSTTVVSLV